MPMIVDPKADHSHADYESWGMLCLGDWVLVKHPRQWSLKRERWVPAVVISIDDLIDYDEYEDNCEAINPLDEIPWSDMDETVDIGVCIMSTDPAITAFEKHYFEIDPDDIVPYDGAVDPRQLEMFPEILPKIT